VFEENCEVYSLSASFANLAERLFVCAATSKKVCADVHATSVRYFYHVAMRNTRLGTDQILARAPVEAL
jgi:hypothetical protein